MCTRYYLFDARTSWWESFFCVRSLPPREGPYFNLSKFNSIQSKFVRDQSENRKALAIAQLDPHGGTKLIHFGDSHYQQFHDKLKHYSHLDHNDLTGKKSYYARHSPATDKNTAKYWAHKILWQLEIISLFFYLILNITISTPNPFFILRYIQPMINISSIFAL